MINQNYPIFAFFASWLRPMV